MGRKKYEKHCEKCGKDFEAAFNSGCPHCGHNGWNLVREDANELRDGLRIVGDRHCIRTCAHRA